MIPAVKLGVLVFFGFLTALAVRPYLQRTIGLPATEADQEDDVTLVVVKLL